MKRFTTFLLCTAMSPLGIAAMVSANGEGAALVSKDIANTRLQAFNAAKKDAVIALINQINGPRASEDSTVQERLNDIIKQVDDSFVQNRGSDKSGNNELVTKVTIQMDDMEFRRILSDAGLGKKSNRTNPIMIVMDEYFTVPTDNQKPIKEYTEYFSDGSASYSAGEQANYNLNAKSAESSSSKAAGRSSAAYAAGYADHWSAGGVAARGSNAYSNSQKSASSASVKESASASSFVNAQQNDIQHFVKYVEYQQRATAADRNNQTLNSIAKAAVNYDLRVMDSDVFRSKYLNGRAMTIQQLTNDAELAKFVAAARNERADYLMMGSSYIYDRGRSKATNQYVCDGIVSFKVYSTADSTLIAAEPRTESASGNTADACRTNVANKLGELSMSQAGASILTQAKNRTTYGNEFTILVKSPSGYVSDNLADELYLALEAIDGANNIDIRRQSSKGHELVLTYKNSRPIGVSLTQALRKDSPALAAGTRSQDGNTITICVGAGQCK